MQIYDDEPGETITKVDYQYSGANDETLNLTIEGKDAKGAEFDANGTNIANYEYCRAGVGTDNSPGSNQGDAGDWIDYTFDFDFTGTISADQEFFSLTNISGTASIIFQNDDPGHTDLNGFYRIDLVINDENSWAVAENSPQLGSNNDAITIPEPATYSVLLGLGVLGLSFKLRKKHCRKA